MKMFAWIQNSSDNMISQGHKNGKYIGNNTQKKLPHSHFIFISFYLIQFNNLINQAIQGNAQLNKQMIKILLYSIRKPSFFLPKIKYDFIFSKLLKKTNVQQQPQQKVQQQQQGNDDKKYLEIDDDQPEDSYDFFQRQKQMDMNRDFRKLKKDNESSIIPEDIGKGGFDQLVYWSQQAKTPQKILELIKKFNKVKSPQKIEDQLNFNSFKANVEATVYLANSYLSLSQYALFGYKYQILDSSYWLKIQQKILRKVPSSQEQINELIDIAFVMGSLKAGQYTYNTVQKLLKDSQLTIDQTAKLIICFFRAQKGQKSWLVKLFLNLQQKMSQINSEVLESVLPIIKQSRNIPTSFDQKLQLRIKQMMGQLKIPAICTVASYYGFQKGGQTLWMALEQRSLELLASSKKQKKKLSRRTLTKLIQGVMSSYKFSTQFVRDQIVKQLQTNNFSALKKLPATTLSTLAKNLYIYQLQVQAKKLCEMIEELILDRFSLIDDVTNQQLIHVLKDYTVTRNGSRQLYQFLQKVVYNKLADITLQRHTIEKFVAIYSQSNLCSEDTLTFLKRFLL